MALPSFKEISKIRHISLILKDTTLKIIFNSKFHVAIY